MDDASLVSDISTLLVSNEFLNESQRKTKKHLRFRLLIKNCIKNSFKIYFVHQTLDGSNIIIYYIVYYTHYLKEPRKTYHKTWLGLHVDSIFPDFWMSSRNYFKILRAKIRGHYKCLFIPSYSMYIRQRWQMYRTGPKGAIHKRKKRVFETHGEFLMFKNRRIKILYWKSDLLFVILKKEHLLVFIPQCF